LKTDKVRNVIRRYKKGFILGAVVAAIVLAMIPQIRHFAEKPLSGAYQLIVDFRVRDMNIHERALSRTSSGAMVYWGSLKKSLLQSCPYLVVLLLPILRIMRFEKDNGKLALLFLVPIIFVGFYAYRYGWHGGFCWNLRYLIPILPFTSMLAAYAWREKIGKINTPWAGFDIRTIAVMTLIVLYVGGLILLTSGAQGAENQEFVILTMPLILAAFLLILWMLSDNFSTSRNNIVGSTTSALFFTAMVWSFFVAFVYDFPRSYNFRRENVNIANMASDLDLTNAIIFTNNYIIFSHLIDKGRVRIACPVRDQYINFPDDFDDMIAFHLQKGHSVYTAFNASIWNKIKKDGFLDKFTVERLKYEEDFILSRLSTPQICN
jgi:hypothetical protein